MYEFIDCKHYLFLDDENKGAIITYECLRNILKRHIKKKLTDNKQEKDIFNSVRICKKEWLDVCHTTDRKYPHQAEVFENRCYKILGKYIGLNIYQIIENMDI